MKIAFYVEGNTESLFLEYYFKNYLTPGTYKVDKKGKNGYLKYIDFSLLRNSETYNYYIQIYNCENDEKVVSRIKENYERIRNAGFDYVFGLRDLELKFPDRTLQEHEQPIINTINKISTSKDLKVFCAVYMIEAWFLSVPDFLLNICSLDSFDEINDLINCNINEVDPQTEFKNPASTIKKILRKYGKDYRKQEKEIHSILSRLNWNDLFVAVPESNKVSKFNEFYSYLESVL